LPFQRLLVGSHVQSRLRAAVRGSLDRSSVGDAYGAPRTSFRISLVLVTVALFSVIGLPSYISATAAVSARDSSIPPFLHPGTALLTVDYWVGLISRFSFCSSPQDMFLICLSSTPVAWVQIAALLGGAVMIVLDKGRRRALAITVVTMIFLLHFYYLLHLDNVLGRVHIVDITISTGRCFPWCSVSRLREPGRSFALA